MRKRLTAVIAGALLLFSFAGTALATSTGTRGQPNQTCLSSTAPSEPGQAASAPGSAFNETGPGQAGTVYAGEQPQNSNNPNSVSQYDVACFQVSQ
jgi:hypothetical protein